MKIIDCYCTFGKPCLPPFRYAATAAELVEEMNYLGIDEAIVSHTSMKEYYPTEGNKRVVEETGAYPFLHPAWAVLPEQTGEQPAPHIFLDQMKESGVKVLYAFPKDNSYILDRLGFGGLLEMMAECRIPLFLRPDWHLMRSLLHDYPELILVCTGSGPHGQDRYFRPLLENYPGFYLETSTYLQDGGIEDICGKYGADRLLFGTGFPGNSSGASLLRILTADIPEEQKALICSGNIERVLGGVKL